MNKSISHNNTLFRKMTNNLFIYFSGGENRKKLMDPKDVFPESKYIESEFIQIKKEINEIINSKQLIAYEHIDKARSSEVSEKWKLYYAYFLKKINPNALEECPSLIRIVSKIPSIINVSIAVLEPGVELSPHCGPHAGILRYHLGIQIPKNNPPSIRVIDEFYTWQEKKSIVLDDYFEHEVINNSSEIRVILMVDFFRPMPTFLHWVNVFSIWLERNWADHFITKVNLLKKS